jgi:predicted ATPase
MPDPQQPRRFVLTGAPGAGKTTLAGALGYPVVAEAATDVIERGQRHGMPEPWTDPGFLAAVLAEQVHRQAEAVPAPVQVFDRSPLCTLALARYLDRPVSPALAGEVDRVVAEGVYQRRVFLVRPLGFVTPTAARRISYPDALRFEQIHQDVYTAHGYDLVDVPAGPVATRVALIRRLIDRSPMRSSKDGR